MVGADGFEDAKYAYGIDIGCELWSIEGDLYVRLGGEVVDLGRLDFVDQFNQTHTISHICVMQMEIRGAFEVSDTLTEINR